ncbi:hypothetical protein BpHYR1_003943 [Brachionus plicatilis]|uniref:Uncharacterized protein n=1 Tax=Brachionus plicatilis TaxID=10195 RepID=A0A3M7QF87_BRAPC|nr:hypothetical protein BpHYR1_003943 [Brachionus plicatilis]
MIELDRSSLFIDSLTTARFINGFYLNSGLEGFVKFGTKEQNKVLLRKFLPQIVVTFFYLWFLQFEVIHLGFKI